RSGGNQEPGAAVERDPTGRTGGVSFPAAAATQRRRIGGRGGLCAGAVPALVRAESRRFTDAIPQHGADVPGDDRGGGWSGQADVDLHSRIFSEATGELAA